MPRLPVTLSLLAVLLSACAGAGCGETSVQLVSDRARIASTADPAPDPGGIGAPPEAPSRSTATPTGNGFALSVEKAVGQMLMSHVSGLTASPRLLGRIRRGEVGSVILYRANITGDQQLLRLTRSLQRAAASGGNPRLLIGVDQEGGTVKRLLHAPPTMSARQMGASPRPRSVARAQGLATARHLRRLGINLDFAPVSDIPSGSDNFLGERAFGSSRQVIAGATGFAEGLAEGGVAGSAKHFPGLGYAGPLDSDFSIVSIGASALRLRAGYAPYKAMSAAGPTVAPLVMISDAAYPSLDPSGAPAVLSGKIVRRELTAAGMSSRTVITDDLEVPLVERYPSAAVEGALAGDDILMYAQRESGSEHAYRSLLSAVTRGRLPRSTVLAAAMKVELLKQTLPGA
jgi:beta-N-acetylhexosaminidase